MTDTETQENGSLQQEEEDWRKKKYRAPIYPNEESPEEIIGYKLLPTFEEHFKAIKNVVDTDRHAIVVKKLGLTSKERREIKKAYERLREKGIWPADVNKYGNIVFKFAVRSDLQEYVESLPTIDRKNFPLSVHFKDVPEEEYYGQ